LKQAANPGRTDPDILSRLQAGDEQAWADFLAEWQQPLYRYLTYSLQDPDHAADVLSETLVAFVQAVQNFDGRVALSTFLYRIAANKRADFWRQRRQVSSLDQDLPTAGPSLLRLEMEEALLALSGPTRDAILLRYHVGLSVTEVADVLGRSYKATESLLSRGRRQLRIALEGALDRA
jgi:RNA polymerase sigma-70 factor (ECF subfamily)